MHQHEGGVGRLRDSDTGEQHEDGSPERRGHAAETEPGKWKRINSVRLAPVLLLNKRTRCGIGLYLINV
jgi:hypothetical protein